jgi:hypothetical protein
VPDCPLAAGPRNLVIASNGRVKVLNKNGTVVTNVSLLTFFSSLGQPATDGTFDPRVVFDEYIQRFWLISASKSDPLPAQLC